MAATYEPIATTTLGSAASSITFSSIAASWTDLRVVLVATTSGAGGVTTIRFNSDTGSNYSQTNLIGNGSSASSSRTTSQTYLTPTYGFGTSSTIPALEIINIFSYSGSNYKTCLMNANEDYNGSGGVENSVGLWRSTSAISTIFLGADNAGGYTFSAGTTATLYGIKAA